MVVQNKLCTPKNGEIPFAATPDLLTSSFLITRKDTFYDRSTFTYICSDIGDDMDLVDFPTPAIVKPVELWSGKQLFNILLRPQANVGVCVDLIVKEKTYTKLDDKKELKTLCPNDAFVYFRNSELISGQIGKVTLANVGVCVDLIVKEKTYTKLDDKKELKTLCPNDGFVYFRNSELISGQIGKVTLGNGNKDGLFSMILRDCKAHAAASCMNRLAKFSMRWISDHGFTIGIDDIQPEEMLINKKDEILSDAYGKCDDLIEAFNKGKLELIAGCDAAQTLETRITEVLNGLRDMTGKVCMQNMHWRNSLLIMSQCGSKRSINISEKVACVGQQSVGGHRPLNGFADRSLPHFPKSAKTSAAKGFVATSFYSGLSATEFFFLSMRGREELVDTEVKTAETGYMSC